ncbi:xanthine dehydrogenase family protein molybdopterin-binding subunit [Roseicella sp. DB1501]|uniref:xanthine dehydrogenase family protein molybdopterin-binding subunit n=1 Tax=Roseicella sp. DB1501 TaxID=2730925 RepID=UPI00149249D8|nr:xanthine dehydrogenase family protein molybdopterin-binding subunit [Roseicella sp. DB1501]NOG69903.1 xanthine dehydrogenase family protein molybdopterin-binding subunit [Roseicella sp. DB1501]
MTDLRIEKPSRRLLLQGAAAGGFLLALRVPPARAVEDAPKPKFGADAMPHGVVNDPLVFVSIAPDGIVTIICHRAEMGQGVRTGMPMIIADELEADWSKVRIEQAPGDEIRYGNQDTDGSRSTRHFLQPMRECGAAARQMLEAAAAKRWGVPAEQVSARNHQLVHAGTNRSLGYGEVAAEAAKLPVPKPETLKLKEASAFRYIGKGELPIVDGFDITTGRARYGQDTVLPGMLFAVVARPPVFGGTVEAVDDSAALKVPGVVKVVRLEGTPPPAKFLPLGGVAVIARNTWAAMQGREALKITWKDGPNASYDSDAYRAAITETARKPAKVLRKEGDLDGAMAKAAKKIEAEYYAPHLAHATMEPPAATVRIADGKVECWTSAQSPYSVRGELSERLKVPMENVSVHIELLGGGFGRKSKCDYAIEAGLLSKAMDGKPVKVVWTREDDIQNGYYHTVQANKLEAGLDADGKAVGWMHRSVFPTIVSIFAPDPKQGAGFEVGMGLYDTPFAIPNMRIENGAAEAHTRIGWFRSVINIPHIFAAHSFVGEMAHAAGRDPKDYLLELIGPARIVDLPVGKDSTEFWNYNEDPRKYPIDTGRLRKVVELAAEKAEWGRKLPPRHGLGIAAHRSFVTYVATVVEVAVDEQGNLSVPRVDVAIDCGFFVNPERVRSQVEGACVMGMSLATKSAITYKQGRVVQSNYTDYEVSRIDDAPRDVRVHIVPAGLDVPPSGVGEPGLPVFAPALCNAIFAATGKRIRELPIGTQLKA